MTTAEKLVKIAENEQKVYKAGQKSMVDESKIIEKTVSGSVISLDDVSEVPHEVSVQLSNGNLISYPYEFTSGTYNGLTINVQSDKGIRINGTATSEFSIALCTLNSILNGTYTASLGAALPRNSTMYLRFDDNLGNKNIIVEAESGSVSISNRKCTDVRLWFGTNATFNNVTLYPYLLNNVTDFSGVAVNVLGKNLFDGIFELGIIAGSSGKEVDDAKYVRSVNYIPVVEGVSYVFSYIPVITTPTLVYEYTADYTYNNTNYVSVVHGSTYIPSKNTKYIRFRPNNNTVDLSLKCQMEVGTVSTVYEAYISEKTYAVGADGKALAKSISPYMTITTDTTGINITATYHKSWGMQTEYDRFWDAFQQNGNRTDYQGAFYGIGWDNTTFKPKYDIKPVGRSSNLIYDTKILGDLVALFDNQGITLDTSGVTRLQYGFAFSELITRIGEINLLKADTSTTYVFNSCYALETIDKLIVNENTVYSYWFDQCRELKEIRFEGTIGNSLDIRWSTKLSAESYYNIISHLSSTATGVKLTVPTNAPTVYDAKYGSGAWKRDTDDNINIKGWSFAYA